MITFLKTIGFEGSARRFVVLMGLFVVLAVGASLTWGVYRHTRDEDEVRRLGDAISDGAGDVHGSTTTVQSGGSVDPSEEFFGGATPEATLGLYVAELEEKDYEEAVRYVIPTARANELAELRASDPTTIAHMIDLLNHANKGSYSLDKNAYTIREPIFIDFVRSPNGAWSIAEL